MLSNNLVVVQSRFGARKRLCQRCLVSIDTGFEKRRRECGDPHRSRCYSMLRPLACGGKTLRVEGISLPFPASETSRYSCRMMSSLSESMPEFAQNFTIWGASGWLLATLHGGGVIPFWACMSITNVFVRTSLIPLVLESAHTSAKFAKVAPEVQFLVTIFQNDLRKQRSKGVSAREQAMLIGKTMQTLRGIYKLHDIHPLAIFKAPLMQIPIFWYFSIDLRKIINGADPELAQQLTESGFLWVTDLTEPDPWYGLPIIAGALLYLNVEVAIGRKNLSGEAASKSKVAIFMKDFFQSLAVFMPCFMSQSPAGVQIYLATSFVFTLFQGAALRNDKFRGMVGLPPLSASPAEATLANEFIEMKKLEEEARKAWGPDGEVLGKGVLAVGWQTSFPGTNRPSSIQGSNVSSTGGVELDGKSLDTTIADPNFFASVPNPSTAHMQVTNVDTSPKVYAPPQDFIEDKISSSLPPKETEETAIIEKSAEERMEAANRGELLNPIVMTTSTEPNEKKQAFDAKRFVEKRKRKKGSKKHRKR